MVNLSSMNDKSAPRAFPWIWYIRLAQIFFSVVVLGIAASNAAALSTITCGVPGKLGYNIACAVLAIIALVYLILSTGPANHFKILPWLIWIQLGLDALMFVFWLAASASSRLNCDDLCHACPLLASLQYDNLYCTCVYVPGIIFKRDTAPASQGFSTLEARRARKTHVGSLAARSAIDSILTILFAITLASTIRWIMTQRQSSGNAAPTIQPLPHEEAGVPMTSTQQTGTNSQMQQGQYYAGQGQPQAQPGYSQSNPQTQYVPPPMHQQPQQEPQQQQQQQQQQAYSSPITQPQPLHYQTGPPPTG